MFAKDIEANKDALTNEIKDKGTLIVSIIIITPTRVVSDIEISAISCDIEVVRISTSFDILDNVSPY